MLKNFWKNNNLVSKNIQIYDKLVNEINCEKVGVLKTYINNYNKNIDINHLK